MTDVTPIFKPFGLCGCGCGIEGPLRTKPWHNDVTCVKRGCTCAHCRGKRSKTKGATFQRTSRKRHSIGTSSIKTGHEELEDSMLWREAKSGSQCRAFLTFFERVCAESEAKRPLGNRRPFVLDASREPDGKFMVTAFGHRSKQEADDAIIALALQHDLLPTILQMAEEQGFDGGGT